jgi:hypothetical protein
MNLKRWHVLSKIVNHYHLSVGVEVGSKAGENIKNVLSLCPSFVFWGIDCWDKNYKYQNWTTQLQLKNEKCFNKVVKLYPDRAKKLKGWSADVVSNFANFSVDLIFIDASHDYQSVLNDIILWLPKVRKGGFICGHDYGHLKFPGVKKAVDEVFANVSTAPDFVWVVKL